MEMMTTNKFTARILRNSVRRKNKLPNPYEKKCSV
jgi:hypothetical protein